MPGCMLWVALRDGAGGRGCGEVPVAQWYASSPTSSAQGYAPSRSTEQAPLPPHLTPGPEEAVGLYH